MEGATAGSIMMRWKYGEVPAVSGNHGSRANGAPVSIE